MQGPLFFFLFSKSVSCDFERVSCLITVKEGGKMMVAVKVNV